MNDALPRRLVVLVITSAAALLFFSLMLASTCTVSGCGSLHSSIWMRIGIQAIPFVIAVAAGWRATHSGAAGALVLSLPWVLATSAASAWVMAYVPQDSQGLQRDSTTTPVTFVIIGGLLAAALLTTFALVGISSMRDAALKWLRGSNHDWMLAASAVTAVAAAVVVCATSLGGSTGIDISVSGSAAAGTAHVELDSCSDAQLLHCTVIAKEVAPGTSFDLPPGIYAIHNQQPSGYQCDGSTPTKLALFPFERLQVEYLDVSCSPLGG